MATDESTADTVQVAELADEPGAFYAIGVPEEMHDMDIADLHAAFERYFEHADFVMMNLPLDGTVTIEEIDPRDLFENYDGGE